ncbi:MAG: hypothetical protein HXS47_07380 [Theionarchaea archaeon]|nr:hypothetical protein [Theionarchaea archaeon]
MGFTDKLAGMFKKKEVEKRETVPCEELESFIREEQSRIEEDILEESAPHIDGILQGAQNLSRFLERLKEMEREEMFKRLDRIVKNSQKRFADSLKNVVTRIHLNSKTYEGLKTFYADVSDQLQQIQKLNAIHGKYLYLAFDKEMKEFSKTAKEIAAHHHMLGNLLEEERERLDTLQELVSHIQRQDSLRGELEDLEENEQKNYEQIRTLESEISSLESKIQQLRSSKEYQTFLEAEKKRETLSQQLKSIEKEIYNMLHPLDRDFRKFKRQVELGHYSFDLNLLERYERLTEQFLQEEEGYPHLKNIAQNMKEALQKQVIKEKGHKREKLLDLLSTILQDGLLELQKKYHSTTRVLDSQESDESIVTSLSALKKQIEEKKSAIKDIQNTIREGTSRKEEIQRSLEDVRETIEEQCSDIGIDFQ